MIRDLANFWSEYIPYKLHPRDDEFLNKNKEKYCLEISIEELREKYGNDLISILIFQVVFTIMVYIYIYYIIYLYYNHNYFYLDRPANK